MPIIFARRKTSLTTINVECTNSSSESAMSTFWRASLPLVLNRLALQPPDPQTITTLTTITWWTTIVMKISLDNSSAKTHSSYSKLTKSFPRQSNNFSLCTKTTPARSPWECSRSLKVSLSRMRGFISPIMLRESWTSCHSLKTS